MNVFFPLLNGSDPRVFMRQLKKSALLLTSDYVVPEAALL
jgi:hypothetical protein